MSLPRPLLLLAAAAAGAIPLAFSGGVAALATTPTPTPTATPAPPTPTPTQFCIYLAPGHTSLQSRLTVNTNDDGSQVALSWGIAADAGGFPDVCYRAPLTWKVFVDDVLIDTVTSPSLTSGASYDVEGLVVGTTHTFRVQPDDDRVKTLSRTFTIEPGYTDPPFEPVPQGTPTPTPTPAPPSPSPGPILCVDPAPGVTDPYEKVTNVTDRSATFSWARFGCRETLAGYDVLVNDKLVRHVDGPANWAGTEQLTNLFFTTTYTVKVIGTLADGSTETVASASFTTGPPDETGWFPTPTPTPTPTPAPTPFCSVRAPLIDDVSAVPVGVQVNVKVTWHHPPGCDNGVTSYRILIDDELVGEQPAGSTSFTFTGLAPDREYRVRVVAIEGTFNTWPSSERSFSTGTTSPPTPTPTVVGPPLAHFSYGLKGSTTINTLTKGSMPLTGSIDAELNVSTGEYSATTVINDTQGRFTVLGFLPVTATIGIVPSGATTGKLVDDQLTANLKARIKVKSVKAFGAIPLAGGNSCQSKQLSDIALKSTDAFDPTGTGGTLGGTYKISDLNGCGVLNGLVSPLTAGGGNTITVKLTPKPAPTPVPPTPLP